jgi:exopolysaccharide biosynthesis polyprenyl glycosylphosphotransferase
LAISRLNKKRSRLRLFIHVLSDWIAASISWLALFLFRKNYIEASKHGYSIPINLDPKLFLGLILIPIFWIFLYALTGYYQHILRRSRLKELENTLATSFFGVLFLFFALILDDSVSDYHDYYISLLILFGFHFFTTLLFRMINSTYTISQIRNRKWGYNTLLIGTKEVAQNLFRELENAKIPEGFKIIGFVRIDLNENNRTYNDSKPPILGDWTELPSIIQQHEIEDVILCNEPEESERIPTIIDTIQNEDIHLKMLPNDYNLVLGMVKMNNILGAMLAEVDFEVMPYWQKFIKRGIDIAVSMVALVILSPLFLLISIAIKANSKGPIFFKQERVGYRGIPFYIIKFRSMRVDAEKEGPKLSSDSDDRRTSVGVFLRKTRLDELPQFINVLLGQMTLVGPRPEREYFINQIVSKAPIYKRLHRVKPGITSWGQIKYGYAESVDEMIDRMKYDILYLENMSLGLDIKIMFNTALIMIQGRGK